MTHLISLPPRAEPSPDPIPPRRIHPTKRPLAGAANDFLSDCIARSLSPRTIEQYEWSLRSFSITLTDPAVSGPARTDPVLADLTPTAARAWSVGLGAKRGPSGVRSAVRALKVFSAWLPREGYMSVDPLAAVRLPNAPEPLIMPLSAGQVAALMRGGSPLLRVAVSVLVDTGLRASELCGLAVEDVRESFLRVVGKGDRERLVPYGDAAAAEITRYVKRVRPAIHHPDERLLLVRSGAPLTPHHLAELMRAAGRRADVRGVRVSPHTLRHTFAIEFLRNGGGELALQKVLGHRSLDMVKIYARLTEVDLANIHVAASPLDHWRRGGAHARTTPVRSSRRSSGDRRDWCA